MKSDDKWLEVLRDRLEDYPMKPSDDLWRNLEQELRMSSPHRARMVPLWMKTAAAASVIALIGGGSYFYFSHSLEKKEGVSGDNYLSRKKEDAVEKVITSGYEATPVKDTTPVGSLLASTVAEVDTTAVQTALQGDMAMAGTARVRQDDAENTETAPETNKQPENHQPQNWYDHIPQEQREATAAAAITGESLSRNRWVVSLTAMNGLPSIGGNTNGGNMSVSTMSDVATGLRPFGGSLSDEYAALHNPLIMDKGTVVQQSATSVKHQVPVSYGLSVRYNVTEKWGVETGMSYTLLNSSFSNDGGDKGVSYTQKLHYVEVPVRVNYTFLSQRWFAFYVAAGGGIAKCVYAKASEATGVDYSLKERPWQLSASSAIGAQLNIVEHAGIYIEPGVGYYFNDKSSLRTVYKDHPWVFKLNFGLRLSY